ncbi:hypothetical protein HDU98_006484 [Podochytrium sp. JEL0797]|nr:hypothetical protein HDU98_006484 [Podochytrium sp. JEL0797]
MSSEPPNITSKYIQALEFKADTLEAENLNLKRRLESVVVENATLKKQVPPPQPATPTPAIQTRTTIKQSLESVAKKLRLAAASPPLLLRDESDGSDISLGPDNFDEENPPASLESRRRKQPVIQTRASAEHHPTSKLSPVDKIKCSTPTCDATFEDKTEQRNHVGNYHTMLGNVTFPGGTKVQVERRADGRVHCFCGKNYTAWSSLRRHAKTCDGTPEVNAKGRSGNSESILSDSR